MKLALAGDTMLGRGVAEALQTLAPRDLVSEGVVEAVRETDLFVLNLECCVSTRGSPWPAPGKPFFFRAPPAALETLLHLGVGCVSLANNHALDFGYDALLDTFAHLEAAGIPWVGAGPDLEAARRPAILETPELRLKVIAATDHPLDFAAAPARPGVAYADLRTDVPSWILEAARAEAAPASGPELTLIMPHWGPNLTREPLPYVRRAAAVLGRQASLVAGHSAHVFHGVERNVLFDLGDFLDDYSVHREMRNDQGLLFLVALDAEGPSSLEAIPLQLEYCHTRLAKGDEARAIRARFAAACAALGTPAREEGERIIVDMR